MSNSKFNMKSTVSAIFSGDRATGRLQTYLFDSQSTVPNADHVLELVNTLNESHKGSTEKCAAINMKCNRMSHAVAKDLELVKGDYSALAIKLDESGVFYSELVKTRKTKKNAFMDAAKAFDKSHSQADMDKLMKAALKLLEIHEQKAA